MANFDVQVESLAGQGSTLTDTEVAQWMNDGAREIINVLPVRLLYKCMKTITLNGDTPTIPYGEVEGKARILEVLRLDADSGGFEQPCIRVDSTMYGKINDPYSIYYATYNTPAYIVHNNILSVSPAPTNAQTASVCYVGYPALIATGGETDDITAQSSIPSFPDEAEYLVVLYASIKALQNKMNEKSTSLPSDLSLPVLGTVGTSLPSYTAPTAFVMPIAPAGANVSFSEVGSIATFTSPVFSAPDLGTIGSLDFSSAPIPPILDATSIDTSGLTNPTFTAPVMVAPDWSDVNYWISTEEDTEMSAARIQAISAQINEFSAKLNESVSQFEKDNAILQKDLQVAMQNASTFEQSKLSKYSSDLQSYQTKINSELQKWTSETFGKPYQEWQQKYQGQLSEYGSDIQKETARVSASVNDYQTKVNKALQTYQAETGFDLSKYQAEIQAQTQRYSNDLQQNTATFNNDLSKYTSEVQKVTADNQNILSKFGQELSDYGAKIQKENTDYQWLQGQYMQLKQDYNQGLQLLIGGGNPPQQGER